MLVSLTRWCCVHCRLSLCCPGERMGVHCSFFAQPIKSESTTCLSRGGAARDAAVPLTRWSCVLRPSNWPNVSVGGWVQEKGNCNRQQHRDRKCSGGTTTVRDIQCVTMLASLPLLSSCHMGWRALWEFERYSLCYNLLMTIRECSLSLNPCPSLHYSQEKRSYNVTRNYCMRANVIRGFTV